MNENIMILVSETSSIKKEELKEVAFFLNNFVNSLN